MAITEKYLKLICNKCKESGRVQIMIDERQISNIKDKIKEIKQDYLCWGCELLRDLDSNTNFNPSLPDLFMNSGKKDNKPYIQNF